MCFRLAYSARHSNAYQLFCCGTVRLNVSEVKKVFIVAYAGKFTWNKNYKNKKKSCDRRPIDWRHRLVTIRIHYTSTSIRQMDRTRFLLHIWIDQWCPFSQRNEWKATNKRVRRKSKEITSKVRQRTIRAIKSIRWIVCKTSSYFKISEKKPQNA